MSHVYSSGCFSWPRSIDPTPPRTTSATNAAEFKESATTPAQNSSNRIPSADVYKINIATIQRYMSTNPKLHQAPNLRQMLVLRLATLPLHHDQGVACFLI